MPFYFSGCGKKCQSLWKRYLLTNYLFNLTINAVFMCVGRCLVFLFLKAIHCLVVGDIMGHSFTTPYGLFVRFVVDFLLPKQIGKRVY